MSSPILALILSGLKRSSGNDRAVYLQLADNILVLIRNGRLSSGQRLPPTRELAGYLQLNRVTVSKAYEELQMQGWLESFTGKGTFVTAHLPGNNLKLQHKSTVGTALKKAGFPIAEKDYLDKKITLVDCPLHLDDGFPDVKLAPLKELYRSYRAQLSRGSLYSRFGAYSSPFGSLYYREALSKYLNETRGMKTTGANVLSVNGTVMGLNLVCSALINPGDIVVSGIPGWGRAEKNFLHAGAKHIGIPVDENGIVVDALEKICRKKKVRLVYVTAHHHYPTTVSLKIDRRLKLLALAKEYGFVILEDDYDFDFHYAHKPLLPLAATDDHGMVIYCGSFSKSFSPAFRMGYLVAAENVIEHLGRVRMLIDRQGDHILDNAMGDLLKDGTIQRYLRKAIAVYRGRRDAFCQSLHDHLSDVVKFSIPEGGMSVWVQFAKKIDLERLSLLARERGLFISDGKAFKYSAFDKNALRLGFASSTPEELEESIRILSRIIRSKR
ncbi:PLP-dependent aminotransferase family protein [Terrimonas sp. NA20]|uniref:PLP-dependent aminotransferase family protein n=1 Tax=Terrimonas ginsenosidimutans TaxID=2908004 RepID=A0ABS9KQS1_9BACT|nr:PLP-dependent aminotransferase family protein [Terrimonas ginsenosidimutans]MCG2614657.1 PLP-dependent aminotransferase family protein [Terrimonas ginsenosidimutans]